MTGPAPSPPALVGRERECAQLDRVLDRTLAGGPVLLEVIGDPGIGKTRLLAELAARATGRGVPALHGRATEFERTMPFGVFVEAVDDHLAGLGPRRLGEVAAEPAGRLTEVFPALAGAAPGGSRPAVYERHRLFHAVRVLLERLAPLVLALDDVHWADPATIDLLAYLGRRPPRAPVLIAVAYRSRQLPPRLAAALAGAGTVRIDVGPLSPTEADRLIGATGSLARRRQLYATAGGNPFYLLALASAGPATGRARAGAGAAVPAADVHRALLAEFSALSPGALSMARGGAVVGEPFEAGLAAAAAGLDDEAEALSGLDELVTRDMIRQEGSEPRFRFRHPLLRQAAYRDAGAGWRLAAHERVAAQLRSRGEPPAVLARHLEQVAQPGDEEAVTVLVGAARAVIGRSPAAAARWLRACLRLLPTDPPGDPRRLALLADLAHAYGLAGQLHASRAVCHELLGLLPVDQVDARARVAASAAMADRLLGRHEEARALLLDVLATVPERAAAGLQFELAAGSLMRSDFAANRTWAARSLALARRHGDRAVQAAALGFLAMASYTNADVQTSAELLDQAAELVDGLPDGELAGRLDAALWLGWNETYLGRSRRAVRHLERGLGLARGTGQVHLLPLFSLCLAMALRWQGRLAEAAGHAEDAVGIAELSASAELRAVTFTIQSWVASWTGDVALALSAARTAVSAAGQLEGWVRGVAGAMLARARIVAGQPAGCVELITESLGGPELRAADPWSRVSWYEVLVRAELALDRVGPAEGWVVRAEAAAAALGSAGHAGLALLARAQVLAAGPHDHRAVGVAAEAARVLAAAGCRLDAARAELLAGTVEPSPDAARATLRRAERLLTECGAEAMARQARRELRRLAARPDPGGAPPEPVVLTARQAEVSRLVAAGLTNREIAEELGVSPKTVEVHLSHVFARLGVPSRAGLASYMTRQGLR